MAKKQRIVLVARKSGKIYYRAPTGKACAVKQGKRVDVAMRSTRCKAINCLNRPRSKFCKQGAVILKLNRLLKSAKRLQRKRGIQ